MKTRINTLICLISVVFISINIDLYSQTQTSGTSTATKYKMTTTIPPGIASPDKIETRLGTLNFFDGFPEDASVEKLYDNLDFQRAVQVYLLGLPAVNMAAYHEWKIRLH